MNNQFKNICKNIFVGIMLFAIALFIVITIKLYVQVNNIAKDVQNWKAEEETRTDFLYTQIQRLGIFSWFPLTKFMPIEEPLKDIVLNSAHPNLRKESLISLYHIYHKKSIPFLKLILSKEVNERDITEVDAQGVIYWTSKLLIEEGEYEFVFPFLMKADVFSFSAELHDKRAIPYMRSALKDPRPFIKISAAFWLCKIGERGDDVFLTLFEYLSKQWEMRKEKCQHLSFLDEIKDTSIKEKIKEKIHKTHECFDAEDISAIQALGTLRDKKALPLLRTFLGSEDPIIVNETKQAMAKIEGGNKNEGNNPL